MSPQLWDAIGITLGTLSLIGWFEIERRLARNRARRRAFTGRNRP